MALHLCSWAPAPLDQLWVLYTSVLLGRELEAGVGWVGISGQAHPRPGASTTPPSSTPVPQLLPEPLVFLLQNLVLHCLRDVRHKPGSDELDAQGYVLWAEAGGRG